MAKMIVRKPGKKTCQFCKENVTGVDYKDTALLRKFITDRGKVRARRVTGNCVQHQRDVVVAIKAARETALLPYVVSSQARETGGVSTASGRSDWTSGLQHLGNGRGDHVGRATTDPVTPSPVPGPTPPKVSARQRLVIARATTELADVDRDRAALAAADSGLPQREIASLLGVSQTEVHRMLRRLRGDAHVPSRSVPREVILKVAVGRISMSDAVRALQELSRADPEPVLVGDGYRAGVWDEVRDAYLDKIISPEVYELLRQQLQGSGALNASSAPDEPEMR